MKNVILCVVAFGLLAALSARAQDDLPPPDMPPPPMQPDSFGMPPPPPGEFPPDSPVAKWIERMKQENPEEFARLQAMKTDDPKAFRRELHKRMKGERALAGLRKYPRIAQAVMEMSEDEREDFLNRFGGMSERSPESPGRGPGFGPGPHGFGGPGGGPEGEGPAQADQDTRRLQREVKDLVLAYHEAPDEAAKDAVRAQLRGRIEQLFEQREAERARQIERIEQDLARLKKSMESRRKNRELIIEKRLGELTADPDLTL